MMNETVKIDVGTCVGCGRCVEVCPAAYLELREGKAVVAGERCIACGQCEAVCLPQAVAVSSLDEGTGDYATFQLGADWVPYGKPDLASLVALMRSRRSCRHFLETPVELARLQDLARIGASAPSGTNCQAWTFTVLPERMAVIRLSESILHFFIRLNTLARLPFLRWCSGDLRTYYRKHYASVEKALREWEETKKDQLFFQAPALIIVGGKRGASTPAEDALLATQNIVLAAHAMGLGSCLIGFATAAIRRDRTIKRSLGIPEDEEVYAVIALGYTDRTYCRITRRREPVLRLVV